MLMFQLNLGANANVATTVNSWLMQMFQPNLGTNANRQPNLGLMQIDNQIWGLTAYFQWSTRRL